MKCALFLFFINILACNEFSRIPIRAFPLLSGERYVDVLIEGKSYSILIDTGSAFSILKKDVLGNIENKRFLTDSSYINLHGKIYSSPFFQVSGVRIGDHFTEHIFGEEDEDHWRDITLKLNPVLYWTLIHWRRYLICQIFQKGMIGIDLFQKFACIFDFPHSSIYLADDLSQITCNEDFTTAEFHVERFELFPCGVVLKLQTDFGEKRLLLDTGCTYSMMFESGKSKNFIHTNKMIMSEKNFGKWKFLTWGVSKESFHGIDGVLGVDFFKKYIICLDFQNRTAYIQEPVMGSKERFTYWLKSYFGL